MEERHADSRTLILPRDEAATPVSARARMVSIVLGIVAIGALAAAWMANGKGMEWNVGPDTMIQVHQASTHFPIGLLLTSAAFDLAALLLRRQDFGVVAFWTLLVGTAGAVGSAMAGFLGNPFAGDTSALGQKVLLHQTIGVVSAVWFILLALWRVARRGRARRGENALIGLMTLVGCVLVAITGYLGGHLME